MVECGDTAVLVTATRSSSREGADFLPLTCDYEERLYAAGRIPGSFTRREGRPPERAVLTSRLIDRPMRPLFRVGCGMIFRSSLPVCPLMRGSLPTYWLSRVHLWQLCWPEYPFMDRWLLCESACLATTLF